MAKSFSQVNAEAQQQSRDTQAKGKYRKAVYFALIAILLALIAYSAAQTAQTTANTNANITNVFEIVVNNTDLGTNGTHERLHDVVYWANTSPIAVYITFHAVGSGAAQSFDANFSINGTIVMDRDFKTSAGSGQHDHFSLYTIVPKFANYSITNSTNIASTEWREYPILSGRNGTLSVNQSVTNVVGGQITAVQAASPLGYSNQSGNVTIHDNRTEYPNSSIRKNISIITNYTNKQQGNPNMINMLFWNNGTYPMLLSVGISLSAPASNADNVASLYLNGTEYQFGTAERGSFQVYNVYTPIYSIVPNSTSYRINTTNNDYANVVYWYEFQMSLV